MLGEKRTRVRITNATHHHKIPDRVLKNAKLGVSVEQNRIMGRIAMAPPPKPIYAGGTQGSRGIRHIPRGELGTGETNYSSTADTMTSIKEKLWKGAMAGAISGGASYFLFGETGSSDLFGLQLPNPVVIGGANMAASVAADVAHEYVLPHIPGNQKFAAAESAALGLGISGFGTAWLLNKEGLTPGTFFNGFALGAGSYAAADWIDGKMNGTSDLMLY